MQQPDFEGGFYCATINIMGDAGSFEQPGQAMPGFSPLHNVDYNVIKGLSGKPENFPHTGSINGSSTEQSVISNAPFSMQLDAISGPSHRRPQANLSPEFENPHAMHRLDMSAITHALLDDGIPPQYYRHQQNAPLSGRSQPSQSSPGFTYPQAQMALMAVQQHMPHSRQGVFPAGIPNSGGRVGHPIQASTYPIYGSYQQFVPQQHMLPQAQDMTAGMLPHYVNPYPHIPLQQYHSLDQRSFLPVQSMNREFLPATGDAAPASRFSAVETTPSYPRGPPRKPKQSGYALWVGNLPPGTNVTDLKDHFSREATDDIESLFLISKSNCAFVNYNTESACAAAMSRFHDSRFNGVRLVCRLRRSTNSTSTPSTPCTPSQPNDGLESPTKRDSSPESVPEKRNSSEVVIASGSNPADGISEPRAPEKYFIVKSLTLQDLDASVRNGVWATQSHNEQALNKAFESADNVYLIFSANKSGEYFGYARMTSPITGEAVAIRPAAQQPEVEGNGSPAEGPVSIPTPATEWAPKGRIVDDSARGTIFWEADGVQTDGITTEQDKRQQQQQARTIEAKQKGQDWGKPFKIEWISTSRLPFYRTRGLRNPWNENREVKIARDGTELEPGIGKRLVQMFHRPMVPAMPQGVVIPTQSPFQPY